MIPIKDNQDVACFFVTKHSWKGKYKRIFSIGNLGITTYNPTTLEVTNKWIYGDFVNLTPIRSVHNEFQITMKKDKKMDTMRFSTDHRAELMTEALRFRHLFAERPKEIMRYHAYKHHWSDVRLPVVLEVTPYSLDQLDPATNHILASYCFKDFEGICTISDYAGGFVVVCGDFARLHLFQSSGADEIKQKIVESAQNHLAVTIKIPNRTITLDDFRMQRFGKFSEDEHLTSVCEFAVNKVHKARHPEPVRRTLCITETCLLERDPQTYSICTLRPLSHIFAVVRDTVDQQRFAIEYVNGQTRTYTSTDRDSLLASLMDGVRASGNKDVHVKMRATERGYRLGPLYLPVDEEAESICVKFLHAAVPPRRSFDECVRRFNANVPYSGLSHSVVTQDGLFSENKEKIITGALLALVAIRERDNDKDDGANDRELESQFQALRRLVASKIGYAAFTALTGFREAVGLKVITALRRNDHGVTYAAIDMICALMHPMHDDYDLRQEQSNKSTLLQTRSFLESLLNMWVTHVAHGTGALVVSAMLDLLTFALCVPYSETTDGDQFDVLLEMVADRGRHLFRLFQHPSMAIVKGAGLLMRALIEEGETEVAAKMQSLALAEGALPRHLLASLYTRASDGRLLTHRQLSRHLIGLWVTGNPVAMALLKRIMPTGLITFLDSQEPVPETAVERELLNYRDNLKMAQDVQSNERKGANWAAVERQLRLVEKRVAYYTNVALQHWGASGLATRRGKERTSDNNNKTKERPIVLRRRRERVKAEANWKLFYWQFEQDHAIPNLIWNHKTREELRCALENEIRTFVSDRELAGSALVAWNHQEFELNYQCLADEIKIGDYYLRLLLEMDDHNDDSPIRRSYEFYNDLYHRYLLTAKIEMKCMCLQAMAIVYGRYFEDIGPFGDTKYIVGMLDRSMDKLERDRLVTFINKLISHRRNVRDLLEAGGIRIMVDLLTLAHLHTSRAVVPTQTNVIEAGPNMHMMAQEKEWYYNTEEIGRKGPCSFQEIKDLFSKHQLTARTRCWASGMDGWRAMSQLPQIKWCLIAKGTAAMNETDLAITILNVLIKMCGYYPSRDQDDAIIRPLPKVKRLISEPTCLSHIVQLLLTFDPVVVEKVATLLTDVMTDNPEMSKLYLTGVFYFILMYTGSNVLPVARFLRLTHTKQAFKADESATSDIMQRSILGQLLPEAMVNYLENHGADKFAQIYLGEYDTPEAIWNAAMRRTLIEKIAAHIADFTPRLRGNTMARYHYIPIPAVRYPQLERELFCNVFYLRHLCDTVKFPDWPIPDPVALLKDVLEAWRAEVEKKPPTMTVEEAYKTLELKGTGGGGAAPNETAVRKAYYKLAQHYHPDKNPTGRERFEQVNRAYEFLCSRSVWTATDGPDPNNIVLVLSTQSILFERYSDVLRPYKYAGYPQLIKTIRLESLDDSLFSKSAPLLSAATELAYRTVLCSALNAEELRRENGLETLLEAYTRCVNVLTASSTWSDTAVNVCHHVTRCFTVAASQFAACRDRIISMPQLVRDVCRVLYFDHLTRLCYACAECVAALASDATLTASLLRCGALWHLLYYMFRYDYTLEEGGVERTEEANKQEVSNRLAKECVRACARMGGYYAGIDGKERKADDRSQGNALARDLLETLLTPYVANKLSTDPAEILKTLNSNSQTPYLIWDNGTRAELLDLLETRRAGNVDFDALSSPSTPLTAEDLLGVDVPFVYTAHAGELIVGNIYVRIYNEQSTYQIEDPKKFARDLLDFLALQYKTELSRLENVAFSTTIGDSLKHSAMSLEALTHLTRNDTTATSGVQKGASAGGSRRSESKIATVLVGHFRLLFDLLSVDHPPIQQNALNVITVSTRYDECVDGIARADVFGHLLLLLYTLPQCQAQILDVLHALATSTKIVRECLAKGGVVYLLDLFCNATVQSIRESCAELLARMCNDKLIGPKVRLTLTAFLPAVFADAMRDNAARAVDMFESAHENPELVWDQDAKDRVCTVVATMRKEHRTLQAQNSSAVWKLPDFGGANSSASPALTADNNKELVIGGVYLRLFIANPAWTLRKPKEFLTELMETCLSLMGKDKANTEMLETATSALCALLRAQPALMDFVPSMGHIPRLCGQMLAASGSTSTAWRSCVPKAAIDIICVLSQNEVCVTSLSQTDCVRPIMQTMRNHGDASVSVSACESLHRLFASGHDQLIRQAIEVDLVSFLLNLLDDDHHRSGSVETGPQVKALIVKTLKSMLRSTLYGDRIKATLEKSPVWSRYKDQRHDLFIASTPHAGYLTAATPTSAGYLTEGPCNNAGKIQMSPPPVDKECPTIRRQDDTI